MLFYIFSSIGFLFFLYCFGLYFTFYTIYKMCGGKGNFFTWWAYP